MSVITPVSDEWAVRPARGVALIIVVLGLAALASVWASGLGGGWRVALSVAVLAGTGHSARRLLSPHLKLRLEADRVLWQRGGCTWSSAVQSPFVSPWFIGWRSHRLGGVGIFRSQLDPEGFRRLAVTLRYSGE